MHSRERKLKDLITAGVTEGVYPGSVILIARQGEVVFFEGVGSLSLVPTPFPLQKDTLFDLASLTKPMVTTLALMKLVDENEVGLDYPLSEYIHSALLKDKKDLTIRQLLNHSAGLLDWKPFYLDLVKYDLLERKRLLRSWIVEEPFAYEPGKGSVYSDLGFMILEWIIEEVTGEKLVSFVRKTFYDPLHLEKTFFISENRLIPFDQEHVAATENCPWRRRVIQGEVHDENAFALGGYSGHAGLFGNAEELFVLINLLREHYQGKRDDFFHPETVKEFFRKQDFVANSTWALGWDTPSPMNSSAGRYFSPKSVGHLGFTGTSVWMDLEKDIVVVFLTNRVHPTRENVEIRAFRPRLHDMIMQAFYSPCSLQEFS